MKNVLPFLRKIKKNNNTPWMHAHKDEYLVAKNEFEFLVQELITRLSTWDSKLPYLGPKNCTFRFNRDIRFSDNKNPYKENFGAYFAYGGKKGNLPGYYLHISPKEVFVASGLWHPSPEDLLKVRRYISEHGETLKKITKKIKLDREQELKRPPKGFDADNPYLEFLKLKSFTSSEKLLPSDILKPSFGALVDKKLQKFQQLNDFLLKSLT